MLKYPNLHIDLYQSIFLVEWWIYLPAQCSFKPLAILIIHDNSKFSEEKIYSGSIWACSFCMAWPLLPPTMYDIRMNTFFREAIFIKGIS